MSAAMVPGLVLAAAGTGAQMYSANRQRQQQQDAINKMMGIDAPLAKQQTDIATQRAAAFTPQATTAAINDAATVEAAKLASSIQDAAASMPKVASATDIGRISPDFAAAKTAWDAKTSADASRINQMYATMFAPSQVNLTRGLSDAELAQRASTIAAERAGNQQAGQLTAQSILPNPWLSFGGQFATGAGSAMAANAGQTAANQKFLGTLFASPKTVGSVS